MRRRRGAKPSGIIGQQSRRLPLTEEQFMSTQNDADRNESYPAESPPSAPSAAELEKVERRLEELREQGIFADGHEPKGKPQTVAHIPGAWARFMERRG